VRDGLISDYMSGLEQLKQRTKNQFTNTPCGSLYLKSKPTVVNLKFYKEAYNYRYKIYSPWLKEYISELATRYNLNNHTKMLEVGHGMGLDALEFKKHNINYTGIDLSNSHHEIAKKMFKLKNQKGEFMLSDCEKLNLSSSSFDFVYSFGVLHHTPRIDNALTNINIVLKKNGVFVLALYSKYSFAYFLKVILYYGILKAYFLKHNASEIRSMVIEENSRETKPYVKVYSIKEARKLVEKNGFVVFRIFKKHLFRETRTNFIPGFLKRFMERIGGWYIIIESKKE